MQHFAASIIASALVLSGVTYFSKDREKYRKVRGVLFILAGISFAVFAMPK